MPLLRQYLSILAYSDATLDFSNHFSSPLEVREIGIPLYSQKLGCLLGAGTLTTSTIRLTVHICSLGYAFMCSQSHRTWGNPPAGCHARRNHVPAAIDSSVIYKDTKTSTMCLAIVYFRSLKPLLINNCLGTIIIIIDVFRDVHNCTYNNGVKVKIPGILFLKYSYNCDTYVITPSLSGKSLSTISRASNTMGIAKCFSATLNAYQRQKTLSKFNSSIQC